MKDLDEINLSDNEPEILRYLYMIDEHESCQDIADGTELKVHQVRYRMPSLDSDEVNILDIEVEENPGDIEDTKKYMLNDRGRQLVTERELKTPKSADNSVRIDSLDDDVKELKRDINDVKEKVDNDEIKEQLDEIQKDIDKIKDWCKNFNEEVTDVVNKHETRLNRIESIIDEES
jgi:predicted transcriptional regulator